MPFAIALLLAIPVVLVEYYGWRPAAFMWAVLFVGSGLLKLLGLGF